MLPPPKAAPIPDPFCCNKITTTRSIAKTTWNTRIAAIIAIEKTEASIPRSEEKIKKSSIASSILHYPRIVKELPKSYENVLSPCYNDRTLWVVNHSRGWAMERIRLARARKEQRGRCNPSVEPTFRFVGNAGRPGVAHAGCQSTPPI